MRITDRRFVALAVGLAAIGCGSTAQRRTFVLTPQYAASKVATRHEYDGGIYCSFATGGGGPSIAPADPSAPGFPTVVGWERNVDRGTDPFPCREAYRQDYLAALYFDLSGVIRDGGVVERATLRFRRSATPHPISVLGRAPRACALYALAPTEDWDGGYYVGPVSDPRANPPATLLFTGTPRAPVQFRNSADAADTDQALDVTRYFATAVLRRADGYHGLLLSPRPATVLRTSLLSAASGSVSCTGLISDFRLELSLVRLVRATP